MTQGRRLAEERKRAGLSQDQLAQHLGVGRSAVGMIESGRSGIDAERLASLLALGIDTTFVLHGTRASDAGEQAVDWELVSQILVSLDRWCKSYRASLRPEETARALKVLYTHFFQTKRVSDDHVADVMDLATRRI